jgi:hypothetical protein
MNGMNTHKLLITMPEPMRAALEEEAKKRNMSMAAIARSSIAEWLARSGYHDIPYRVQWGGVRETANQE